MRVTVRVAVAVWVAVAVRVGVEETVGDAVTPGICDCVAVASGGAGVAVSLPRAGVAVSLPRAGAGVVVRRPPAGTTVTATVSVAMLRPTAAGVGLGERTPAASESAKTAKATAPTPAATSRPRDAGLGGRITCVVPLDCVRPANARRISSADWKRWFGAGARALKMIRCRPNVTSGHSCLGGVSGAQAASRGASGGA